MGVGEREEGVALRLWGEGVTMADIDIGMVGCLRGGVKIDI